MRDFVFGSDLNYDILKETLEDGLCHVYHNCSFPTSFSKQSGRLGFEKEGETYALFIDKGISTSSPNAPALLRYWLETGTLRFLDYEDLKDFLKSLVALF